MDVARLGQGGRLWHRFISAGQHGELYEIQRGDLHCALRIPLARAGPEASDAVIRAWRVTAALDGTDVPHARAIALCTDPTVLGRPFYLTRFVDGWSPARARGSWPAPFDANDEARRGLAFELIEGIARLSRVNWRKQGLADFGEPEGFHERQVCFWADAFEQVKGRELPGFDETAGWLRSHRPLDYIPGIMHGDYQFGSVIFRHGRVPELAAITGWEASTVGDPKLDLGWVVQSWPEGIFGTSQSANGPLDLAGLPSRSELLAHYAVVSGRQVDDIDYYCVLARWKLAVLHERAYQRSRPGGEQDALGQAALSLMRGAAELAESSGYRS
jgi:aminoglycoside phosphotransferase (APT) family kinase protein